MHTFNRILVVLFSLLVGAAAVGFIALLYSNDAFDLGNSDSLFFTATADGSGTAKTIATVAAGAIAGLALILLILELTPPRGRYVDLHEGKEDSVRVSPRDISRSVEADAERVRHVEEAKANVETAGKGVVANINLYLDHSAEPAVVTEEVQRSVEDGLYSRYGIRLARKPNIDIHYRERKHRDKDREEVHSVAYATNGGSGEKSDRNGDFEHERERDRQEAMADARSAPIEGSTVSAGPATEVEGVSGSPVGSDKRGGNFEREREREKARAEARSADTPE